MTLLVEDGLTSRTVLTRMLQQGELNELRA